MTTLRPAGNASALTRSQQGVLHAQLVDPATTAFTVGEAVELRGDVDVAALVRSIENTGVAVPGWDLRIDAEGRHSLWPAFRPAPAGWTITFGPGSRADALAHVTDNWPDIVPRTRA